MSTTDLERRCQDVLASLREALGATRARLYAMGPTGTYRLMASLGYGRREPAEQHLDPGCPLLEWVQLHRRPTIANGPHEAGPLAVEMGEQRCARLLAAPIYVGSRMIGVLELRDRASGAPFSRKDLLQVEETVARLAELLRGEGAAPDQEEERSELDLAEQLFLGHHDSRLTFPPPPPLFHAPPETARGTPADGVAVTHETGADLTRREVLVFKGFVNALLLGPEIEAVVFSHWRSERAELYVGARRQFGERARGLLLRSLEEALASAAPETAVPREKLFNTEYALGRADGEVEAFAGVQTSVVRSEPAGTLLFTLVFACEPSAESRLALGETHRLVRSAVAEIRSSTRYQGAYRSLVNAFLEPGARRYPRWKAHSLSVGVLSRRLAAAVRLAGETVEQVTVAALLHDVGLRELDLPYERLVERRPLSAHEMASARRHPVVGASLLERVEFPYAVAPLVRSHHERFDGTGYPDRLFGTAIPLGSRIIAVAEAFDAMTARDSYRAPIGREEALQAIEREAGSQFDPELTAAFCQLIRSDPARS